jgi:hypothetical protein
MKRICTAGLFAALLASAPAGAQVTVKLTAPNVPNGGTVAAFGVYMSPYSGTVDGQQVILNCDDFFHEVTVGEVWQANETSLGTGSNLSNTRFDDLALYQQAAWLTTQYASNPGLNASTKGETIAIQTAIWDLFEGQTGNAPDPAISVIDQNNSSWWVQQAQTNYATAGLDYSTFSVLTGVDSRINQDGASAQEFIIHTTPEPGTLVLLATGLFGLVLFVRRRRGASPSGSAAFL